MSKVAFATALAKLGAQLRITDKLREGVRQRFGGARRNNEARLAMLDDFGYTSPIRGDNWQAGAHGLYTDQAETFCSEERRETEDVRIRVGLEK
jgi:hypothetical protein